MVRMAIIKMSTNNDAEKGVEKGTPLLAGLQTGTATVENSVEIP